MVRQISKRKDLSSRVSIFYSLMDITRKKLLKLLDTIDDASFFKTLEDRRIESIGTLLIHIAAIEWSWIFEDIEGEKMDFDTWKHAFALRPSVNIPQISGEDRQFFLDRLNSVRSQVFDRLKIMEDSDLDKVIKSEEKEYTIEWILWHIIEHELIHIGQISLLTRINSIPQYHG